MRKVLISLAAAASALAVATPASAQFFPQPQGYGYGYNNYGQVRRLHNRVEQLRHHIRRLDQLDRLSSREARRLDERALGLHRRIEMAAYRGLNGYERNDLERRIEGLRQTIRNEVRDGERRGYDRDHERWHDRNDYDRQHDRWHDRNDDDHDDDHDD